MAFSFPTKFGRYLPTFCGSLRPTRTLVCSVLVRAAVKPHVGADAIACRLTAYPASKDTIGGQSLFEYSS